MQFRENHKINTKMKFIYYFLLIPFFLLIIPSINAQHKKYVVVLDAGHGGHDPGKIGYKKAKEKDIALKVVLLMGKKLSYQKDIKVVYTRKKDVYVDLWKRGNIANDVHADLFVSVHCNAHNTQASGAETWVLGLHANKRNFEVAKQENAVILKEDNYKEKYKGFDPNSPESVIGLTLIQEENLDKSLLLATNIQNNLTKKLKRKNRGVKQAGFVVLYQTTMPSVLIETGFITNKYEGRFLNSKSGQEKMATQIADAIKKYIYRLKVNTVVSVPKKNNEVGVNTQKPIFKVQLASGKKRLATKSYNFRGLKGVERVKVGSLYKYYYGISTDYATTKKSLELARKKGYPTAFMVAFKKGKKISVKKALKN